MKAQFNKVKKLAAQLKAESHKLDQLIENRWGFHYSETDDDPMIDTLDYGTGALSYSSFVERMESYKKFKKENGYFQAMP